MNSKFTVGEKVKLNRRISGLDMGQTYTIKAIEMVAIDTSDANIIELNKTGGIIFESDLDKYEQKEEDENE